MSDDGSDRRNDADRGESDDQAGEPTDDTREDESSDPFERLGAPDRPDDRDPFAEIDESVTGSRDGADQPPPFDDLGFERSGGERDAQGPAEPESRADASVEDPSAAPAPDQTAEDPFARLGGGRRDGDPFAGLGGDAGGRETTAELDDDLWEDLSQSMAEPETEERGDRRFAEVDKHSYCENCEYFSEPPDIECAHEGTDIIEFVDYETVRLADCPVVAEREELAEMDADH